MTDSGLKGRSVPLDALRGLAAIVVVIHHFTLAFWPELHGPLLGFPLNHALLGTPFFVIMNGRSMVVLFFVLSGYVLAQKGWGVNAAAHIRHTAAVRWFRLAPLVCLSTLLSAAFFALGWYRFEDAYAFSHSQWLQTFGATGLKQHDMPGFALALKQGLCGVFILGNSSFNTSFSSFNTSLWTMRWEFYGSFLVLALAWRVRRNNFPRLALIVLMLYGGLLWLGLSLLSPFIAGFFIALLCRRFFPRLGWKMTAISLLMGLYGCGYFYPVRLYGWVAALPFEGSTSQMLVHTLGASLIVLVFACDNKVAGAFTGPLSRELGMLSFPLYIIHFLPIFSLCSAIYASFAGSALGVVLAALALLATALPISILLGRWDRWWVRWLRGFAGKGETQS